MMCKACGKEISDNAAFCDHCGHLVAKTSGKLNEPEGAYSVKKDKGCLIIIGITMLALVLLMVLSSFLSGGKSGGCALSNVISGNGSIGANKGGASGGNATNNHDAILDMPIPNVPASQEDLELVGGEAALKLSQDEIGTYITGQVKNNTDSLYTKVEVKIGVYDVEGVKMGTVVGKLNNLGAGDSWEFKAAGITPRPIERFQLEGISGIR